ncbi:MAG TPA: ATP-dependent DNA helicase RecG [Bacilli bacterium]|nr:ATP-dependent DNA helicase RecG [Bacilli bacterium]
MDKLTSSDRIKEALTKMGIESFYDVIYHLPRAYDSFFVTEETNLKPKERVVLVGRIAGVPTFARHDRITIVSFPFVTEKKHYYRIVAFNRPYLLKTIKMGDIYTLVGSFNQFKNEINLQTIVRGEMDDNHRLRPVYSLPMSLSNFEFIRLVEKSFTHINHHIDDYLPAQIAEKYHFFSEEESLKRIHFPRTHEDIRLGLRRLKYEEALLFSLKTGLIREENKALAKTNKQPIPLKEVNRIVTALPYHLTGDQLKAIREIILDMNETPLMYRLLQGDVGTGKTLVAAIALYANFLRHDQGVLLVPTDILARQHYNFLQKLLAPFAVRVSLLIGSLTLEEKNRQHKRIEAGEVDVVVGTHALFSEGVNYHSLGLAIIDEQHRFGVNQRQSLAGKGDHTDLLLMSATPIPRTLSLTIYGDLDVTTLKEFPGAKRNIVTQITDNSDPNIFVQVHRAIVDDNQIFVIAPRIENASGKDELNSTEEIYRLYAKEFGDEVVMVHGQMNDEEKNLSFAAFSQKKSHILVATSIVEVGIDVPNATLMIVYSPENFGLASLHQLRGRIGRRGQKATCLLVASNQDDERLKALEASNDGFKIAEEDLRLRGPGQMEGTRQSGLPDFAYLNLVQDFKIIEAAHEDAKQILNADDRENTKIIARAQTEIIRNTFTNV